jgi:hypothetical protein
MYYNQTIQNVYLHATTRLMQHDLRVLLKTLLLDYQQNGAIYPSWVCDWGQDGDGLSMTKVPEHMKVHPASLRCTPNVGENLARNGLLPAEGTTQNSSWQP